MLEFRTYESIDMIIYKVFKRYSLQLTMRLTSVSSVKTIMFSRYGFRYKI